MMRSVIFWRFSGAIEGIRSLSETQERFSAAGQIFHSAANGASVCCWAGFNSVHSGWASGSSDWRSIGVGDGMVVVVIGEATGAAAGTSLAVEDGGSSAVEDGGSLAAPARPAAIIPLLTTAAADWQSVVAAFANPSADFRFFQYGTHDGAPLPMDRMAEAGIGGVMLFMQSHGYLRSDDAWRNLETNVRAARAAGLRVHLDGARFANAVASICLEHLGATAHEITLEQALARCRENYAAGFDRL